MRIEDDTVMQPAFGRTRPARRLADSTITIVVETADDIRVVRITGELDITSADLVTRRCTNGPPRHVVIDLADLTFLDCGGYRSFVAARTTLALQHRTLTLVGAVGEPRRLLELISHLNPGEPARSSGRFPVLHPPAHRNRSNPTAQTNLDHNRTNVDE